MGLAVDAPDETVTIQQGQAEIPKLTPVPRYVALDLVVEIEYIAATISLDDDVIEWR